MRHATAQGMYHFPPLARSHCPSGGSRAFRGRQDAVTTPPPSLVTTEHCSQSRGHSLIPERAPGWPFPGSPCSTPHKTWVGGNRGPAFLGEAGSLCALAGGLLEQQAWRHHRCHSYLEGAGDGNGTFLNPVITSQDRLGPRGPSQARMRLPALQTAAQSASSADCHRPGRAGSDCAWAGGRRAGRWGWGGWVSMRTGRCGQVAGQGWGQPSSGPQQVSLGSWPGHPWQVSGHHGLRKNLLGQRPGVGCTAHYSGDPERGIHLVCSWPEACTWQAVWLGQKKLPGLEGQAGGGRISLQRGGLEQRWGEGEGGGRMDRSVGRGAGGRQDVLSPGGGPIFT